MAGYCKHSNGHSCSIKGREFIYYTIKVKGKVVPVLNLLSTMP
jgi:hypothetical protein